MGLTRLIISQYLSLLVAGCNFIELLLLSDSIYTLFVCFCLFLSSMWALLCIGYCYIGASVDGRLPCWCACFANKVLSLSLSLSPTGVWEELADQVVHREQLFINSLSANNAYLKTLYRLHCTWRQWNGDSFVSLHRLYMQHLSVNLPILWQH